MAGNLPLLTFSLQPLAFSLCFVTPFVRLWIWISAFATLAGWGLSAVGQLNRAGYATVFVIAVIVLFLKSWGKHPTSNIQ